MEVRINNQAHQFARGTSLQALLSEFGFTEAKGIAVAVNEEVMPKSSWQSYQLEANDTITIIRATQGG